MKKSMYKNLMLLSVLLIAACGTSTYITGSYKAPGVTTVSYKKVFITVLTANTVVKQKVETGLAQYFNSKGIATVKSIDVFPPDFHTSGNDKNKDTVLKGIRQAGCDGIFTVALENKETDTHYVPGTASIYPSVGVAYYGTFGTYYRYGYSTFYSPGYYTTDRTYYLETNLYDVADEKLIWSAQSKTYNPSSLDSFLQDYEQAITQQVIKDGLVATAAK
ncbi:hypothetical protein HDF24_19115 [Mucilaginibacter sp. X4EP1]|uniref:hypothetical protein n=1 Tax=Mucilaginibacter sp. X4EP1 TaxID=2723092 RepID=UPI002166E366|nr:hypothetical protein [Mucilaginibacter sp. X4EP1]MCS3813313.1 hypothetical protein [Mucilaginibacter sp. X4EP1]